MGEPLTRGNDTTAGAAIGRAKVTVAGPGLVIEAPGPRSAAVPLPAVLFGVPWFTAVIILGVWYLGWGEVPAGFWVRVLFLVLALALTHNLSTLAYITIWNALYARIGVETLTIDPEYITVLRTAGRFKREHLIGRKIIEVAELLGPDSRRPGRPRIEIKSWRAAIGFGAGLDQQEAEACAGVIQELFDRDEAVRHASEAARGYVRAEGDYSLQRPAEGDDEDGTEQVRTSVMQAYREALESRGSLRTRLGAIASVARPGRRGGRRSSR